MTRAVRAKRLRRAARQAHPVAHGAGGHGRQVTRRATSHRAFRPSHLSAGDRAALLGAADLRRFGLSEGYPAVMILLGNILLAVGVICAILFLLAILGVVAMPVSTLIIVAVVCIVLGVFLRGDHRRVR